MELSICGGGTLELQDGTLATFVGTNGQIIATLSVAGNCWKDIQSLNTKTTFDPCSESHIEYETTARDVPATDAPIQQSGLQTLRICRDKLGNIIKCPPR